MASPLKVYVPPVAVVVLAVFAPVRLIVTPEVTAPLTVPEMLYVGAAVTVRVTVAVCDVPPPVPVTVMVYEPVAVVEATAMVMVEVPDPGAAIEVGLKVTVTPVGWPDADKAIAESKPPDTAVVMVDVPLLPCTTETEVGEAAMVKLADVEPPARALIRLTPFGLPQPVTRSYPVTAE